MRDYVIITDSACDISSDILNEWGVGFTYFSKHSALSHIHHISSLPLHFYLVKINGSAIFFSTADSCNNYLHHFNRIVEVYRLFSGSQPINK